MFSNFKVNIRYVYVFPDINLPEGTNDQAGQDNFNAAKVEANETRTRVYSELQAYDWNSYRASTGLELQDGNVDNYNLGEVEAYCSEDGAVVRKCNDADLSCGQESCPCTKTVGTVTKCSKCIYYFCVWDIPTPINKFYLDSGTPGIIVITGRLHQWSCELLPQCFNDYFKFTSSFYFYPTS